MSYKCSGCEFYSLYNSTVKNHIDRKNKCSENTLEIIRINLEIKCNYCNNKLSNNSSLIRHLKTCKIKILQDKKNKKDKELMKKQLKTINNTTNNTMTNSNSNNTINNYITISLTPYNDPNMEGMQQYLEAALRKTFLSVPNLIESVHFNKEYPENQNICLTNKRTKDAKVFDGRKWKTVNKEVLINEIVDTYERELSNYAEEQGKTRYIKEYESAKKRGNGEKDLKDEVHNILYDNNEMVNTKIKEVKKLVIEDLKKKLEDSEDSEDSENSKDSEKSDDIEVPIDEYAEFQKHMQDSDYDSDHDY
jgi:hypothetical protein